MAGCVSRHASHAPACIESTEQPAGQPPETFRQLIVDIYAQQARSRAKLNHKSHFVIADDHEAGR